MSYNITANKTGEDCYFMVVTAGTTHGKQAFIAYPGGLIGMYGTRLFDCCVALVCFLRVVFSIVFIYGIIHGLLYMYSLYWTYSLVQILVLCG